MKINALASFKFISFIFILTLNTLGIAGPYMTPLRHDLTVPEHCQDPNVQDFFNIKSIVTYSITGATDKGFTHEYPIKRGEANKLWHLLKQGNRKYKKLGLTQRVQNFYDLIIPRYQEKDFDFGSEGEVLEILALMDLETQYPPSEYFHTGGIEYTAYLQKQYHTQGELDIVVGKRSDCQIVVIGETKLGLHRLPKAKKQIQRFLGFVNKMKETFKRENTQN